MKKIVLIILIGLFFFTACEKEVSKESGSKVTSKPSSSKTVSNAQIHEHCTRNGNVTNGSSDLSYEIYYTGDNLNRIESTEIVISDRSDVLDTYEEAYRKIHSYYKEVDYYYTEVVRSDDRVMSIIKIDYDHVDADTLIAMEGEENNVYENKVAKISKFRDLAKKFGLSCNEVS